MFKQVQKLIGLIALWISLPVFLMTTNPESLPLPMLIVPFILLMAGIYVTVDLFIRALLKDVTNTNKRAMSAIAAVLPTLLLLLASIRQLTIRDTAIVLGLLGLLLFYLRRLDFAKNN